jgi:hypothetical protein
MWNVKCHKTALQSRNCPYKSIIKILKTRHFPQCYPSFFTKLLQVAASTKVGSFRVFHWWSPATWPEISNGMWQLHLFKNTLWYTSSLLLKMAIEIVELPHKKWWIFRCFFCMFTKLLYVLWMFSAANLTEWQLNGWARALADPKESPQDPRTAEDIGICVDSPSMTHDTYFDIIS